MPRILVVDDNKDTCRIFATADDGDEALKNILPLRPDFILLDLMMPRMDGFEVCRTIKNSSYRSIPVLILTSASYQDQQLFQCPSPFDAASLFFLPLFTQ